jgi:hypothetical protein
VAGIVTAAVLGVWFLRPSHRAAPSSAPVTAIEQPHHQPPPPPEAPKTTVAVARVPGVDEAEALIRAGRTAAALDLLRKLRAKHPADPEVAYLMGNLYFDRMWWNDGFEAYRVALSGNPAYRKDPLLISNVVKSFISERYAPIGARFIEREIGSAAIPSLEEAARSTSPNVRGHASRLLAKLER